MTVLLVCEGCGEVFSPAAAPDIEIIGPDYACADYERYACPDCGYIGRCLPPRSRRSFRSSPPRMSRNRDSISGLARRTNGSRSTDGVQTLKR